MRETANYTVQLPVFEGPLDLLLELIERAELDITKVALAEVTDQYLDHMRALQEHRLDDLASFLVIAARLLQIKSEALLPRPVEREPGEEDPGDALARQLIEYRRYKQIAELLSQREQRGMRSFFRIAPVRSMEPKLDLGGITLTDLRRALVDALAASPKEASLGRVVVPPQVNIRDKIGLILRAIRAAGKATFRNLISGVESRIEVVVSFLALLELVRLGRIIAEQSELFGEIELSAGERWESDQEAELELEFE
jgi:segregation and condensation protein A